MKFNKRILKCICFALLTVCLAFAFASCNDGDVEGTVWHSGEESPENDLRKIGHIISGFALG